MTIGFKMLLRTFRILELDAACVVLHTVKPGLLRPTQIDLIPTCKLLKPFWLLCWALHEKTKASAIRCTRRSRSLLLPGVADGAL